MLTCFTNRIANREQLAGNNISDNDSIRHHINFCKQQERLLYKTTKLMNPVSGFLMVIKKSTWDRVKFTEDMKFLGVDNDYHERLTASGLDVLRMDGIYIWHTYRLIQGAKNKDHLI
jgi:GT2 family glycosyltransferase